MYCADEAWLSKMWLWMLVCVSYVTSTRGTCGGDVWLTSPHGVIQTPGFPLAPPAPLRCRWVIAAGNNASIALYFTQQFTTSGLSFTQYQYYDHTYQLGAKTVLTITTDNVTKLKSLQVRAPFLVVSLSLDRLEGAALRALGLLSVWGFNMTYVVSGDPPPATCSALACSLLGHCLATHDFSSFYCACLSGYSGADCSVGPLCERRANTCRNGGTCRQLGPVSVSCSCPEGFTGDFCETSLAPPECSKEECADFCEGGSACDCTARHNDTSLVRLEAHVELATYDVTPEMIRRQVVEVIREANITLEHEVDLFNVSCSSVGSRCVGVSLWAGRGAVHALRTATQRLRAHHYTQQPVPHIQSLAASSGGAVRTGEEAFLSCVVSGSPQVAWYKDGGRVNLQQAHPRLWTRVVEEPGLSRTTFVLGIMSTVAADGGRWVCLARLADAVQCRAARLTVLPPPRVSVSPRSVTVSRGDNVSIVCLTHTRTAPGVSWSRGDRLLALTPGRELWEDLYPAGTLLRLYNVQKSAAYRCGLSSVVRWARVWALGVGEAECPSDTGWPRTAPGAESERACPSNHTGRVTRLCEPVIGELNSAKWKPPDYSECIHDTLKQIYEQFGLLSLGYSWTPVDELCAQYRSALARPATILRELGAGAVPYSHASHMLAHAAHVHTDAHAYTARHSLHIFDMLLRHELSFASEQFVLSLQQDVCTAALMLVNISTPLDLTSFAMWRAGGSGAVRGSVTSHGWRLHDVTSHAVLYVDIAQHLPSLRTHREYRDGERVTYVVTSPQVQVCAHTHANVTLVFTRTQNHTEHGEVVCAGRTGAWQLSACVTTRHDDTTVLCRCVGPHTYALLERTSPHTLRKNNPKDGVWLYACISVSALCACVCVLWLFSCVREARVSKLKKAAAVYMRARRDSGGARVCTVTSQRALPRPDVLCRRQSLSLASPPRLACVCDRQCGSVPNVRDVTLQPHYQHDVTRANLGFDVTPPPNLRLTEVNARWRRAYDAPQSELVMHHLRDDLHYLLSSSAGPRALERTAVP